MALPGSNQGLEQEGGKLDSSPCLYASGLNDHQLLHNQCGYTVA
jgi:hypothetical protein